MSLLSGAVLLIALLAASACASASETAFFSLSPAERERLAAHSGFGARALKRLLAGPERLLLTLLLANLLTNLLFLSAAAELALSLERARHAAAAVLVETLAAFALVMGGELLPKIVARPRATAVASRLAWPVLLLEQILILPVWLLGRTIRGVTYLLVGTPQLLAERHRGFADFSRLIDLSHRKGQLAEQQRTLLHEVIGFSSLRVRDVMVPRVDVAAVDVDAPRAAALEEIRARSVSRLVACHGDLDHVAGQVCAHEILLGPEVPFGRLVRPIPAVPAIGSARGALALLQRTGSALALAVDEHGGTAGLVTLNDLVAQVVGEMADEHAVPVRRVVERAHDRFLLAGWTSLREWRERSGADERDPSATTVGGLVLRRLDRSPEVGDVVATEWFEYRVRRVRGGRIVLLEARRLKSPAVETAP